MTTINKARVRRLLLDLAKKRSHKFTRVSDTVYFEAHSMIVTWAMRKVMEQPSKGKTIR
jgi:hypothetical protein